MRIGHLILGLLVTAILWLGAPPDGRAQAPSTLLIKGATIIDGVSDAPLRDRSLLIEGNTIRDVLPADAAAPAGAQVLDLSGKFIIPGLFDSHVHWEEYMGELFVNHGVTSIVALENAPKALRARTARTPRIFRGSFTRADGCSSPTTSRKPMSARWCGPGSATNPISHGSRNTTTGTPAPMRSQPMKPTRRAS